MADRRYQAMEPSAVITSGMHCRSSGRDPPYLRGPEHHPDSSHSRVIGDLNGDGILGTNPTRWIMSDRDSDNQSDSAANHGPAINADDLAMIVRD